MQSNTNHRIAVAIAALSCAVVGAFVTKPWQAASDGGTANTNTVCDSDAAERMVFVEGGIFIMGSDNSYPEEGPAHWVEIVPFSISRTEVTNRQFSAFVTETGYRTVAEQQPDPAEFPEIPAEMLKAGSVVFKMPRTAREGVSGGWAFVEGANWRHPNGPDSTIAGLEDHPVVHISLEDAKAYANWKGHRLPTEAEFEYAARAQNPEHIYAWGEQLAPAGSHKANTWQGFFPFEDAGADGYIGLAPVGCFDANAQGAYDMIGNVWEWTQSAYYPSHGVPDDASLSGYDPRQPGVAVGVIKGGSYLCSPTYCMRYRPSARHAQERALGTNHIGFRTVKDN